MFHESIATTLNLNERGPRHHGVNLFQKDPLARYLGCNLEAAISTNSLFMTRFYHPTVLNDRVLQTFLNRAVLL
jgi:hypothetical protein